MTAPPDRFTAELYDLRHDPSEMTNLVANARYQSHARRLERRLEQLSRKAGPERMPVKQSIQDTLPKY